MLQTVIKLPNTSVSFRSHVRDLVETQQRQAKIHDFEVAACK